MQLTDTRTHSVEAITPTTPRHLKIYACGPTVYRYAHVGNLRTFVLTDLIQRVAEVVHGWQVTVVRNITDVGHMAGGKVNGDGVAGDRAPGDKVLAQAAAEGKSALGVARFYEEAFHRDLEALNVHPAEANPRASESIPLILDLVAALLASGHAYVGGDGSVFFDARSFPTYGALSGNRLDELVPGHRFEGGVDPNKRFHADWALWKRAGNRREMVWDSPWGLGFPGWHVECSAMSMHYLGEHVDVHTGGIDLRFPHHEDERAQSESVAGHEVVHRWVHGEHLLFEGRKMAKSAGNVVLLADVVDRGFDPLALRLAFLEARYRTQLNLTWAAVAAADHTLARWRAHVAEWAELPSKPMCADYRNTAFDALDDDLDTVSALQVLRRLEKDTQIPAGSKFETFAHLDRVLGLDLVRFVGRPHHTGQLPPGAADLLSARESARAARDWAASDRLRDELAARGVAVADTPSGQTWSLTGAG